MRQVDDYVKQAYRYYYDDGLVEIAVGLLLVVVGSALIAWELVSSSALRAAILVVGLPVFIFGGTLLVRQFVQKMKERITYDRTGYVSYRRGEPANSRWFLILAMLLLFGLMYLLPEAFSKMQFAAGYSLAAFLCYLGYRLGLSRFYVIGVAAFLIGLFATITIESEVEGTGLTIAGAGLLLLISGVLAFFRYLRRHPEPRNEQA